jgi:hypothetical protein
MSYKKKKLFFIYKTLINKILLIFKGLFLIKNYLLILFDLKFN